MAIFVSVYKLFTSAQLLALLIFVSDRERKFQRMREVCKHKIRTWYIKHMIELAHSI